MQGKPLQINPQQAAANILAEIKNHEAEVKRLRYAHDEIVKHGEKLMPIFTMLREYGRVASADTNNGNGHITGLNGMTNRAACLAVINGTGKPMSTQAVHDAMLAGGVKRCNIDGLRTDLARFTNEKLIVRLNKGVYASTKVSKKAGKKLAGARALLDSSNGHGDLSVKEMARETLRQAGKPMTSVDVSQMMLNTGWKTDAAQPRATVHDALATAAKRGWVRRVKNPEGGKVKWLWEYAGA